MRAQSPCLELRRSRARLAPPPLEEALPETDPERVALADLDLDVGVLRGRDLTTPQFLAELLDLGQLGPNLPFKPLDPLASTKHRLPLSMTGRRARARRREPRGHGIGQH